MSKKEVKFKVGRDAGSGKFMRVEDAKKKPKKSVVETITKKVVVRKPK